MGFDACARASWAINRSTRANQQRRSRLVYVCVWLCGMGFSIVYTLQHALAVNNHTIKSTRSPVIYYLRCDAGKTTPAALLYRPTVRKENLSYRIASGLSSAIKLMQMALRMRFNIKCKHQAPRRWIKIAKRTLTRTDCSFNNANGDKLRIYTHLNF
jgi:hypothetical protein